MGLQSSHGFESVLQSAVVAFDAVVLVLAGVVQCGRDQLVDHVRQSRSSVGDDLAWVTGNSQGGGEELARGGDVAALGHVHVDYLAVLVDCPDQTPETLT